MAKDHQQHMGDDARELDQLADQDAEAKNVDNFGAGWEKVRTQKGNMTVVTEEGKFGMLPSYQIPLDHTIERQQWFREVSLDHKKRKWDGTPSARSLEQMMKNYTHDAGVLPTAEREYNLLVPLANMAARAYAKADSLGVMSDKEWSVEDSMRDKLSDKEEKGIAGALKGGDGKRLDRVNSLTNASLGLVKARKALDRASHSFARRTNEAAIAALEAQKKDKKDKIEEIEASKAKIMKYVGFIETAGAGIAGAGAFANSMAAGAPEAAEPSKPDLRPKEYATTEAVGQGIEKGGGYLSQAVSFGIDLFNHDKLHALHAAINNIQAELSAHGALDSWHKVEEGKADFDDALQGYGNALKIYGDQVEQRRVEMAVVGAEADKAVDKKGRNHNASEAVLWMETVMELNVHLATAVEAGTAAHQTVEGIYWKDPESVSKHRSKDWGTSREHWEADSTPYTEIGRFGGHGGADADALFAMSKMLRGWLEGAQRVQGFVQKSAEGDMKEFLAAPTGDQKDGGYSGDF